MLTCTVWCLKYNLIELPLDTHKTAIFQFSYAKVKQIPEVFC